jgi:hypothetical protein
MAASYVYPTHFSGGASPSPTTLFAFFKTSQIFLKIFKKGIDKRKHL